MDIKQKKQFIDNLTKKLQGVNNPEYSRFLDECMSIYNSESSSNITDFNIEDIPVVASGVTKVNPLKTVAMGELLAEGSGEGSKAIFGWVAFNVVIAIIFFIFASTLGYTEELGGWWQGGFTIVRVRTPVWGMFMLLGAVYIILAPMVANAISKTNIKVYEGGIAGRGISKWFYWGDIRGFDFMLSYDQVSVDVNGGQIVIHGSGTHYKVYVSNGSEIQQIIYRQKNKR
ncbi:MAG: hypothetical protein FWE20_03205 [Defluviitaleaceae bacterium]|nr:hypothetical protein [Defluviitaleaceae bacterium]